MLKHLINSVKSLCGDAELPNVDFTLLVHSMAPRRTLQIAMSSLLQEKDLCNRITKANSETMSEKNSLAYMLLLIIKKIICLWWKAFFLEGTKSFFWIWSSFKISTILVWRRFFKAFLGFLKDLFLFLRCLTCWTKHVATPKDGA